MTHPISRLIRELHHDDEAQGLAEYALILVFVSIVAVAALTLLGTSISSLLNQVAGSL